MSIGPRQLDPRALEAAVEVATGEIDIEIYEEAYWGTLSTHARVENMNEVVTKAIRAYLDEVGL